MNRVKVTNKIETYDNGATLPITVSSHWNKRSLVVLRVGEETVTVSAEDLRKAISNATNT